MLYLTCTIISNVDLAHYGVSCAKDWVFVDCGTIKFNSDCIYVFQLYISVHIRRTRRAFSDQQTASLHTFSWDQYI